MGWANALVARTLLAWLGVAELATGVNGRVGATCGDGICELFVPRDGYDSFAAELLKSGGSFDLIEPRRRDVEEYFLDLVRSSGGASCG